MAVALVVCVALICGAVLSDRHWPVKRPPSVLEQRTREQVIVTLTTGEAFSGLLWEVDDKAWVLRDAVALGSASARRAVGVGVDGEVILLAGMVAFAQRT